MDVRGGAADARVLRDSGAALLLRPHVVPQRPVRHHAAPAGVPGAAWSHSGRPGAAGCVANELAGGLCVRHSSGIRNLAQGMWVGCQSGVRGCSAHHVPCLPPPPRGQRPSPKPQRDGPQPRPGSPGRPRAAGPGPAGPLPGPRPGGPPGRAVVVSLVRVSAVVGLNCGRPGAAYWSSPGCTEASVAPREPPPPAPVVCRLYDGAEEDTVVSTATHPGRLFI